MNNTNYSYNKKMKYPFYEAVNIIKDSLKKEGFSILTEANIKNTLKNKINVDIENYVILGACSPANAYKAIQNEIEIGLLLPCNIIIYEKGKEIFVSAILSTVSMGITNNINITQIAKNIEEQLKRSIDNI